jgi:hypothetical protein
MAFDPNSDEYGNQGDIFKYEDNLPPSDYILVGKFMSFSTSSKGVDYAKIRMEVLSGPAKGASYWQFQTLNFSKEGSKNRLAWFCRACRFNRTFNENDPAQLADMALLRPFKACISRKTDNYGVKNDIVRYYIPGKDRQVGKAEIEIFDKWLDSHKDMRINYKDYRDQADVNYGSPPPSDDDCEERLVMDEDIPF